MPYSQRFLDRGKRALELPRKSDIKGAILEWSKDKYLIASGNDAARGRLFDLLSASPQDMTHPDYFLQNKPALPRLSEIRVPTLILVGEADIPDVHAHTIPNSRRVVIERAGHLMYLERPAEFTQRVFSFIGGNGD